jgi:hypothetical protein
VAAQFPSFYKFDLSDKIVREGHSERWQWSGKTGSSAGWQQYWLPMWLVIRG